MSCVESGCIFQWTIENFQLLPKISGELISPPFSFNSIPDTQWQLELHNFVNVSRCFLKRSSSITRLKIRCCLTLQFGDTTECTGKRPLMFQAGDDLLLLKHCYTEVHKKYYGNRNLVLVCHFDGDFFKHEKRTKFYYARTRVNVMRHNFATTLNLNDVIVPKGDVYEHNIVNSLVQSSLFVSKTPCTLNDLSLQSTVNKYPLSMFTKVYLYDSLGTIVGVGNGLYHFYRNGKIRQVIHFKGNREKPTSEYVEDLLLKISVQFNVSCDFFTYMERTEDLDRIKIFNNHVYELNLYAPLREGDLNYKICISDQVFYANKDYLRVISPYFKNLITQNENECEITEINTDMVRLQKLFDILYCKESLSNYKEYSDLHCFYTLSQQFQFVPLINTLSRSLETAFSVTNIGEIFLLSSIYDDQDLRTAAFNYFIVHLKSVLNQQTWRKFSEKEPKLACEVIIDAIKTSK